MILFILSLGAKLIQVFNVYDRRSKDHFPA